MTRDKQDIFNYGGGLGSLLPANIKLSLSEISSQAGTSSDANLPPKPTNQSPVNMESATNSVDASIAQQQQVATDKKKTLMYVGIGVGVLALAIGGYFLFK